MHGYASALIQRNHETLLTMNDRHPSDPCACLAKASKAQAETRIKSHMSSDHCDEENIGPQNWEDFDDHVAESFDVYFGTYGIRADTVRGSFSIDLYRRLRGLLRRFYSVVVESTLRMYSRRSPAHCILQRRFLDEYNRTPGFARRPAHAVQRLTQPCLLSSANYNYYQSCPGGGYVTV
ncbi:hypothetical protein BJV78DRAFT_1268160 [Lactifluus subvellereus]|nr:hypothetical protein BJV78DRAFT_1268160 [Lactifluus subvellereus]